VQPVGGRAEHVDVRVVAATNRDLGADVKTGRFREDLFYRLDVVSIRVPPLRERESDIAPLVETFVRTYTERYGMGVVEIDPPLLAAFAKHAWPGNVRELENTIARLLALAPDDGKLTLSLWSSPSPPAATGDTGRGHPLRRRVEMFERSLIAEQFEASGKNQSETARRLGISRPALIEKLHKYGLIGE
jgi:two-component system response regulator AtoC